MPSLRNNGFGERRGALEEQKVRFPLYVQASTMDMIEENYKKDGCKSKTEFIESAVQFYCGYLNANDYSAYLPNIVISTMKGSLGSMERRMANLLFKVAVELAMMQNLLAANQKIQRSTLDSLRGMCVREVKSLNGSLKLDDAVMLSDE